MRSRWTILALGLAAVAGLGWAALYLARGRPKGAPTILLVTVDTLRPDAMGVYGAEQKTPRMDALAARGTRFVNARTPVPLTLPAHTTMMTGLPPGRHGVRTNTASRVPPRERRSFPLLAERLTDAGRRCGAFVSAGPLVKRYGLAQGFETYDDEGLSDRTGSRYQERPGPRTVERALAWLGRQEKDAPVFLWVHLFEPHDPHPEGLSPAAGYAADVQAADAAVGLLLDGLAAAGRGDAVVLFASDHGEAPGGEGAPPHGFLLGEAVLRVPLILAGPGVPAGRVRSDPVDLADVAPTIAHLAGIDPAPLTGVGAGLDLLLGDAPADRPRVAESLHAHHQFRWAQLTSALVGNALLEDRGLGRERLFRIDPAAPEGPRGDGVSAEGRAEGVPAADALREYRRLENRTPAQPGRAPGGYGAGGSVGPLLEPAENAKRPDPYAAIPDAARLAQIGARAAWALSPQNPVKVLPAEGVRQLLAALDPVAARDPGDPAVWFIRGDVLYAARRLPEASEAYAKAWELGRDDPETVLRWAGALADQGGEERLREAAEKVEAGLQRVGEEVRLLCLLTRLRRDLRDPVAADAALARAKASVQDAEDAKRLAAGCR